MQEKYNKYWRDIPLLYSFAFVLDPRAKIKGFTKVLRKLGNLTSTDYSAYQGGTRARLTNVYNKYEEKYGAVRLRRIVLKTCLVRKGLPGMKYMMMMMMMIMMILVGVLVLQCYILLLTCLEIHLLLLCCMLLLL
jgi:hypothetical protein